jgi:AraC-like DNA-binding protein
MTGSIASPASSDCPRDWERLVSATYYRQEVRAPHPQGFDGRLSVLQLGPLSLSHIRSSPVTYRRRAVQIRSQSENHHLVTIPLAGDLFFEQRDRRSHCPANCFVTERGDLPYELHQPGRNELLVFKLPESLLDGHLPRGTAFAGHVIGRHDGFAGLFIDYVRALMSREQDFDPGRQRIIGRQLVELLAGALSDDRSSVESAEPAVRDAHMRRIKAAIRQRLHDPELTPARIAAACQLSVRYLHRLFAATGTTMGRWLIEQRLADCDAVLRDPRSRESLATLANRHGFYDQPQFCRHYKRRFGCTPGETRAQARRAAGPG